VALSRTSSGGSYVFRAWPFRGSPWRHTPSGYVGEFLVGALFPRVRGAGVLVPIRVCWLVATASLIVLATAGTASAHVRIGTLAVDVRVSLTSPRSSPQGAYALSVSEADRALHLTVRKGHRLIVLGYLGAPVLRIDARGLAINLDSPTAAAAGLVTKAELAGKRGGWLLRRGERTAVWRDPRLQQLPNNVGRAAWTIPIRVDGRSARITGVLQRAPLPSLWPRLLVVLASGSLAALAAFGRGRRRLRTWCIVFGAAAPITGVVAAAGPAFEAGASGMRVAAVYELMLAAGGAGFAIWGPLEVRVAAIGWLSLLGLIGGLACGQVFLHGFVLSVLPAAFTRTAAALAIGFGAAGSLLAAVFYASVPTSHRRGNRISW
jgi:hypothetical protein